MNGNRGWKDVIINEINKEQLRNAAQKSEVVNDAFTTVNQRGLKQITRKILMLLQKK